MFRVISSKLDHLVNVHFSLQLLYLLVSRSCCFHFWSLIYAELSVSRSYFDNWYLGLFAFYLLISHYYIIAICVTLLLPDLLVSRFCFVLSFAFFASAFFCFASAVSFLFSLLVSCFFSCFHVPVFPCSVSLPFRCHLISSFCWFLLFSVSLTALSLGVSLQSSFVSLSLAIAFPLVS